MSKDYQAIVIGAGPGGYPCAIRLAQLGVKTLVIEKAYWGGVCLNVGCIPSKALIGASNTYQKMLHASELGFDVTGEIKPNMTKLQEWKSSVVNKLTGGVKMLLKANGVEQMMGTAKLVAPDTVSVSTPDGEKTLTADAIVIATGSTPIEIPGFSFSDEHIIDSTGALDLSEIPKHLAVIGGGYIGLEMSGVFARLGSEVTVVEMQDQLLPGFDPDVVKVVARRAKKDGVKAMLKTRALGWKKAKGGVALTVQDDKDKETVEVRQGSRHRTPPQLCQPGARRARCRNGRTLHQGGQVAPDQCRWCLRHRRRGWPACWRTRRPEGEVVARSSPMVRLDYKAVPAVVFTGPDRTSLTEPEAKAAGHDCLVGKS